MSDWRKPFLELKAGLRPLFDANLSIYHAVLLSTRRTSQELQPVIEMLEPAYSGKNLVKTIGVKTPGTEYHAHHFFADDRRGLDQLGRLLYDIEDWMDHTPGGFLPGFHIPPINNQADRNLLRWVSTVYYLAWASDAPYLDVEVEYQDSVDRVGFFPWLECPQPPGCRPQEWLIHRASASEDLVKIRQRFEDQGERFPDVVDAYLTGEFIASSMAAIDILAHVMHGERKERQVEKEEYAEKLAKNKRGTLKDSKDVEYLKLFLLNHHNHWENTNIDVNVELPLKWHEIAKKMEWSGKPRAVQGRVNRSMKRLFGPNPMTEYKKELVKAIHSDRPQGTSLLYRALVNPGRRQVARP